MRTPTLLSTAGLVTLAAALTAMGSHATAAAPSVPTRLSPDSTFAVLGTEGEPPVQVPDLGTNTVDPAAFDIGALAAARAIAVAPGSQPWSQVGTGGAITEVPASGGLLDGRLKNTGIVLDIATDPTDTTGKVAFIGTGGGLWKTTDGGDSWTQAKGVPASSVGAVGVSPANHDDVYAITGQAFQSGDPGGSGIYVSHDGGVTFARPASNVGGAGGQHVDVAPDGTVFAATSGGLFRSTDRGATWTDVRLPTDAAGDGPATGTPVGSWTTDVRVRPGSPQEVYAAVGYVAGNVMTSDGHPAAPGNGLYKSMSAGAPGTWTRVVGAQSSTTGWKANPTESADPIGRTELTFSPDGSVLWALVADAGHRSGGVPGDGQLPAGTLASVPVHPDSLNGLYRSDATLGAIGDSWVLKATSAQLTASPGSAQPVLSAASLASYDAGIQAWYNGYIAVDPTDANRIIVGEEEVYESDTANTPAPGLAEFNAIDEYTALCALADQSLCAATSLYATHPDQHGVAFAVTPAGSRLWIGNDGGVFHQDSTVTGFKLGGWTSGASYNTLLPYRAAKSTAQGHTMVDAGLQDNGTVLWKDGQKDSLPWCGGDGSIAAISPTDVDTDYCNANGSLMVSTDGGATATDISPPNVAPSFQPASFVLDPADEKHLVTGAADVVETLKGPATTTDPTGTTSDWQVVYTFPTTPTGAQPTLTAVDAVGTAVYAAACPAGMCNSSVKGAASTITRTIATNVKAGCTRVTGTGACWHTVGLKGFPNREITALSIDPADVSTIYAATEIPSVVRFDFGDTQRVLVSHDAGETWSDASGNLPAGNTFDIKVAGSHVYVAHDTGVFSTTLGSTTWQRVGSNLPESRVAGLSLSSDRTELVAALYGSGVWTTSLLPPGAAPLPKGVLKPVHHPKAVKKTAKPVTKPSGSLAATGAPEALAIIGLGLLGAGFVLGRRQRRS